jgi:hypothetical protein
MTRFSIFGTPAVWYTTTRARVRATPCRKASAQTRGGGGGISLQKKQGTSLSIEQLTRPPEQKNTEK